MEEHCYIVSYDLCTPGRSNYEELYAKLKSYAYWGKLTESTWAIVTTENSVQIRDSLRSTIDENDRLIVIKSGQEAAWIKTKATSEWVKTNIVK